MSVTHIPNKQRREESDKKIIRAAIKNFGKNGYSHTSISQIAADAGVSPGLITNRYSSKEELFESAFLVAFENVSAVTYKSMETREFLVSSIDSILSVYNNDIDVFYFMSMIYTSYDKPEHFKIVSREEFIKSKAYDGLLKAQKDGILQKGDIVNLVDAFLTHVYVQIDICKRFELELPSHDYFLSAILCENKGDVAFYSQQYMDLLLKEYQSSWIIDIKDRTLKLYRYDEKKSVPDSVQTAKKISSYDEARKWYVENYVVNQSKQKVLEQSDIDYILPRIKGKRSFFIEYGRISKGKINYNQLCYNKIVDRSGNIEAIALGFRNIDIGKRTEIDDLTGLYTRQTFFRKAEEMLEKYSEKQFDICISDIVDFKKINETYGVTVADKILRWEGEYLLTLVNDELIIGRYGGDQMVMFGSHELIKAIIDEDHRKVFNEAKKESGLPDISIKFGIYEDVSKNSSIVSSCDKAHTALNSIKHHYEKEIEYYNDDIKTKLEKQRRIEASMHKSMKNGDFKVYFQPKHDAKTGKLLGAEALIRWIHPEYGFMSPADFIPLFEQNGFIVENDKFVWTKTCENLKKWLDKGIKVVPISVNASKLTMSDNKALLKMKDAVTQYNISTEYLHVEITETLMTDNTEELVQKLNKIREMGIKIELDDFGSGFSSINILSILPIDILKLDMSFMQEFGDKKRYLVLESCIELAKKLGFKTVSEGVELLEQKDELGKLGVDMIQGYYYSKPLPEEEFEKYLIEHSEA